MPDGYTIVPLRAKYLIGGKVSNKGGNKSSRFSCRVCGGASPKRRGGGYIHPKCRANRRDKGIRVRPRGGPWGGRKSL